MDPSDYINDSFQPFTTKVKRACELAKCRGPFVRFEHNFREFVVYSEDEPDKLIALFMSGKLESSDVAN